MNLSFLLYAIIGYIALHKRKLECPRYFFFLLLKIQKTDFIEIILVLIDIRNYNTQTKPYRRK